MNLVRRDSYCQRHIIYLEDLIGKLVSTIDQQKNFKDFSKRKKFGYRIVKDILL